MINMDKFLQRGGVLSRHNKIRTDWSSKLRFARPIGFYTRIRSRPQQPATRPKTLRQLYEFGYVTPDFSRGVFAA